MTRPTVAHRLRIRVGVINIPFKVRRWAWKRCITRLLDRVDIGGVNESFTVKQRRVYRQVAHSKGFAWYGTLGPNPIFWDADKWKLVSGRRKRLHPPGTSRRAHLFPGYNAAREVTEVVLESIQHPGTEIAVLNWHGVPSGPRVPRLWRIRMRALTKAHIAGLVDKHLAEGRPTYSIGDTNIYRAFVLGAIRWLRRRGVDKVGPALPRGWLIEAKRVYTFPAPTDHRRGVVTIVRLIFTPRST